MKNIFLFVFCLYLYSQGATSTWYVTTGNSTGNTGVDSANGFSSLSEWSTVQAAATDSETVICNGSTVMDTIAVVIPPDLAYFYIKTSASSIHTGKWDTTKYRLSVPNPQAGAINCAAGNGKLEGLQIGIRGTWSSVYGIYHTGKGSLTISRCIVFLDTTGNGGAWISNAVGVYLAGESDTSVVKMSNNIIQNFRFDTSAGVHLYAWNANAKRYIYNNNFIRCDTGLLAGASQKVYAKNNIFYHCRVPASGTFEIGTDYNATDSSSIGYTTSGNTHDKVSDNITFDADSFHISQSDTGVVNKGVNLSEDADYPFNIDIDGATRGTVWDIGVDEITSVAPNISYAASPATCAATHYYAFSMSNTGGSPDSVLMVSGYTLPAGLTLNKVTGLVNGTPTTPAGQADFKIYAMNSYGNDTATLNLTIVAANQWPGPISYAPSHINVKLGDSVYQTVTNGGGAITSYTISPSLTKGLSFNTTTGVISGRPDTVVTQTIYKVKGFNTVGSDSCYDTINIRITQYYYVDFATGDDANSGTSKAAPWKHSPLMQNTTGICSTHVIVPGDTIVFKGGVTWDSTCFKLDLYGLGSGTAELPVCFTADTTWYTGGSFTRPIFDNNYKLPAVGLSMVYVVGQYICFNNIEFKRMKDTADYMAFFVLSEANHIVINNCYLHDWQYTGALDGQHGGVMCYSTSNSNTISNTTISNAAYSGTKNSGNASRGIDTVRNCIIHDVSSALLIVKVVENCTFYNISYPLASFDPAYHTNLAYISGDGRFTGNNLYNFNAGETIYPNPNSNGYSTCMNGTITISGNTVDYGTIGQTAPALDIDPLWELPAGENIGHGGTVDILNNLFIIRNAAVSTWRISLRSGDTLSSVSSHGNTWVHPNAAELSTLQPYNAPSYGSVLVASVSGDTWMTPGHYDSLILAISYPNDTVFTTQAFTQDAILSGSVDSVKAISTLPTGLSVTKTGVNAGRITGTVALGDTLAKAGYLIRVYGAGDSVSCYDTLTVLEGAIVPSISYSNDTVITTQAFTQNATLSGSVDSVKAISTLPTGLSVTKTGVNAGRITGTVASGGSHAKTGYLIRVYGANDSASCYDTLTVIEVPTISYSNDTVITMQAFTQNAVLSGTVDSVKAISTLPTGLSVTKTGADAGRITGTVASGAAHAKTGYLIRVYGANDSASCYDTLTILEGDSLVITSYFLQTDTIRCNWFKVQSTDSAIFNAPIIVRDSIVYIPGSIVVARTGSRVESTHGYPLTVKLNHISNTPRVVNKGSIIKWR